MPARLKSLPTFACLDDNENINLWPKLQFQSTNREANEIGRGRADEVIQFIRRTGDPSLLGHIMRAIAAQGEAFTGLENGFFYALSAAIEKPNVITEFVTAPPERQFRVGRKFRHLSVVAQDCDHCEIAAPAVTAAA